MILCHGWPLPNIQSSRETLQELFTVGWQNHAFLSGVPRYLNVLKEHLNQKTLCLMRYCQTFLWNFPYQCLDWLSQVNPSLLLVNSPSFPNKSPDSAVVITRSWPSTPTPSALPAATFGSGCAARGRTTKVQWRILLADLEMLESYGQDVKTSRLG